jgi:hypothetical protein
MHNIIDWDTLDMHHIFAGVMPSMSDILAKRKTCGSSEIKTIFASSGFSRDLVLTKLGKEDAD